MSADIKAAARQRRVKRVRSRIQGDSRRPRLSVSFSNRHIVAQLIDDNSGKTLAYATSRSVPKSSGPQRLEAVASAISKQAKASKLSKVVLDRRYKPYHGQVAAFAEAVRKQGLEF